MPGAGNKVKGKKGKWAVDFSSCNNVDEELLPPGYLTNVSGDQNVKFPLQIVNVLLSKAFF